MIVLISCRYRKSSNQPCNGFGGVLKEQGIGRYEEPDKIVSSDQGTDYELTECPVYEATEQLSDITGAKDSSG